MAEKKIIAVVGATGAQGGGLVRAILEDGNGEFAVRALTRNPESDKAKALAAAGAEVVKADLDDKASLQNAFEGAYGAFCLTNFWEHFSPEKELAQAKNMAEAAKDAGIKHCIWSTLEDTREWVPLDADQMPTLMEKYKVPHFDAKGMANQLFTDAGVPTTFLLTSFYWDNFIFFGSGPQKDQNGKLALTMPIGEAKMPGIAAEDIGRCAYGIFKRGSEFIGKTVGIAGEHVSGREFAEGMSKALGQDVYYNSVDPSTYRALGFPGAEDLGNMFQFKRDFEDYFRGVRNVEFSRELNPQLQSYQDWLAKNASRIPLE